ncbi:hypothetical protein Pan258_51630 [Symmachiella dynata]|uniref:DUF3299 domain-containing protein n=1 Tax=Symmachiella dynata TaxID=2527995 RepID=UPI0011879446|nr:DUF3299 domain-containing protein [Symmachiella dynata]QDT51080.1 hypothetical protein Pan258_51630 [Symmachiella dynata]
MSTIEAPQHHEMEESTETAVETSTATPISPAVDKEFDYRPVTPLAPIALFFGLCSAAGFLAWEALAIGAMGFLMGAAALWKIRSSGGELGGSMLAKIGLTLSLIGVVGGSTLLTYQYIAELPEGHERISFKWFARQAPKVANGQYQLDEDILALDNKDIFIKGYMFPGRKTTDIDTFVLVKDSGDCCFGGQPKIEDMILVELQNDMKIDLRSQTTPVGIGGKLRLDNRVRISDGLRPVYTLEGYHVR